MKSPKKQKAERSWNARRETGRTTKSWGRAVGANKSNWQAEQILSQAFFYISESVCITDLENHISYVNPAFLQSYGYTQEELIGQDITIVVSPANPPELVREILPATLRGGWQGELLNRKKDGSEFPISLSTSVVRDESGKTMALTAFATDISSRKRAEEALQLSEERYRTLVEGASDIIYRTDATGHFTFVNPVAVRILKRPPEAIINHHYTELIHPQHRAAVRRFYRRQFVRRTPVTYSEFRVATNDDNPLWFGQNVQLVMNEGKVEAFQAVCRDVTDRKLAEEAFFEAQRHYKALVNSVEGIVWECDAHTFQFRFVSEKAVRLLGYPAERWLAEPNFWQDHIHRDDKERVIDHFLSATLKKIDHEMEYRMIAADGRTVWLRDLITVVVKEDKPVLLRGIMVDISEQVRLREHLLQMQKLDAVAQLAGGIAHELNNILMIILGRIQLLRSQLKAAAPLCRDLDVLYSAGTRAKSLLHQLFAFGRRHDLQPRVIDVNSIVNNTDHMLGHLIGEDIQFLVTTDPKVGRVKVDPGQIEQALVNLVLNARDAMPDGGKITIETANVELDETYCRLHWEVQPGSYVMIAVTDTGTGMDAQTQARVFEPFFTTKEPGKGSGLGLSVTYGIVKQSGGHISVFSEVGKGSIFRIHLPRIDEPVPDVPSPARDRESAKGAETILVIEDEDEVRELLRNVLESAGYTVLTADRGAEAIRLSRQYDKVVHVVLSDMVMPGMSGLEATRRLVSERSSIKIILMSGYPDRPRDDLPANTLFLLKPFSNEEILAKLREVL